MQLTKPLKFDQNKELFALKMITDYIKRGPLCVLTFVQYSNCSDSDIPCFWMSRLRRETRLNKNESGINFTNIFCANFLYKNLTGEKLPKRRSYEKFVRKMLMKLMAGINFTDIFRKTFTKADPKAQKRLMAWL